METPYTSSQTYIDDFDPVDYYRAYYDPEEKAITGEWSEFALKNLHETFTSGGVKGDLLIDFGAGPAIYHLLSACEVFNNIITSDFLEQNLAQLQKWLRNDPDAIDWTKTVKLVCELEGNRGVGTFIYRLHSPGQKVDFSDESSVELHHSHRKYCRRPNGTRMEPRFTQKTMKFGGGKIMVWGYIQYGDVRGICRVEGNINSLKNQELDPQRANK